MSSLLKLIADKLLPKSKTTNLGNELSVVIGVLFEAKNLLKNLGFSFKLGASLLPALSGWN